MVRTGVIWSSASRSGGLGVGSSNLPAPTNVSSTWRVLMGDVALRDIADCEKDVDALPPCRAARARDRGPGSSTSRTMDDTSAMPSSWRDSSASTRASQRFGHCSRSDSVALEAIEASADMPSLGEAGFPRHGCDVGFLWCASEARITCGGGFHPASCRLSW
jgi:hypothetical protein